MKIIKWSLIFPPKVPAANSRIQELNSIHDLRGLPIVVGELGYSNAINVDDATQNAVLKAEFDGLRGLSFIAGLNYWVGAGTSSSGGYTHIFNGDTGSWGLRSAATSLSDYFASRM